MDRRNTRHRQAFTIVELLVVISIMVLLATMTIGAIRLTVTSEQVRSGARTIQSAIEGSRDRAIYAEEARGIRLLVDESVTVDHDGDPSTDEIAPLVTSFVYIGSPGADESEPDRDDFDLDGDRDEPFPPGPDRLDFDNDGDTTELFPGGPFVNLVNPNATPNPLLQKAIIGVGTRWSGLYEQGLIGPGSRIGITTGSLSDIKSSGHWGTLHPASFTNVTDPTLSGVNREFDVFGGDVNSNNVDDEVLFLSRDNTLGVEIANSYGAGTDLLPVPGEGDRFAFHFSLETAPDVLQGEDPIALPRNVVLNLWNSRLPQQWVSTSTDPANPAKFSNRMDLLFSPSGAIVGDIGSAGVIHLHLCDIGDAMSNTQPGSPTKPDGTERDGDEFGITIFTQSGRVNVHPLDSGSNPWQFGIEGELAR